MNDFMPPKQDSLFSASRLNMRDSIEMSLTSLRTWFPMHPHVVVMFSGGKSVV